MEFITPNEFIDWAIKSSGPALDVRSDVEFLKGAMPNSVCIPLLTTPERVAVGTCYKQSGKDAALSLGHQIVSGPTKQRRIELWAKLVSEGAGVLYCWRGGLRSKLSQQWLAASGIEIPRVEGGYKAIRNELLARIDDYSRNQPLLMVSGMTGAGKTRLLQASRGRVLDLEQLARHRGSSFGKVFGDQPCQQTFENTLGLKMVELSESAEPGPILVEAESKMIGHVKLPPVLFAQMQDCPVVVLEESFENRVRNIWQEYVLELFERFCVENPERGAAELQRFLTRAVEVNSSRLGSELTKEICALIWQACEHGADYGLHSKWIELLLSRYYDRFYFTHIQSYTERIVKRGEFVELCEWLSGPECQAVSGRYQS